MDFLETNLKKLAEFQKKHAKVLAITIVIITLILGAGLRNLSINSDVRAEMPLNLPIFKLNDRITDKFGGKDTIIIAVKLNESVDLKSAVRDIRDPRVIQSLIFLDNELRNEKDINSISSPASFFRGKTKISEEEMAQVLRTPEANRFFSRDYRTTLMYISADLGSDEDKIKSFNERVQRYIDYTPKPPGVEFSITGSPVLRITIFDLLRRDATVTLAASAGIILLLLFIMQRSFMHGMLIFAPLSLGLVWTMGTLGWFGIPLSVATVSLSSMILGLGVEYGVFVVSRYKEERNKNVDQLNSLKTTVHGIGTAIIGSGLTTIMGFLALSFATMPMIQRLGQSLALGIAFCLLAALIVNPVLILLAEEYEVKSIERKLRKLEAEAKRRNIWGKDA